ncbi:hypothetical protein GW943_02045 [Candidatus Parcubacteria bacterium]|uniref:Uncharacterized protein n=1 Tax=Candidatus Kaiserbacteria bacterium CG10_big_fil_rev_8_21_14_0_10_47_16 TaxID=1974608 RepID=A0A2H0UEJ2_9BACT|nr:hypothetical protein [Candidatus Parcubacteria bacterium]PIR84811.1 MAG: hypothetical protein COU16_01335 [Candidatus Kaiserbacteria bacterium CG10_big_fil_rev_8_21_14_0_10_47_16]
MEKIKEIINNITPTDYIFVFLTIIGFILTFVFYRKSIKNRKPLYAVRSTNLIKNAVGGINDLDISYLGSKVENLSIARVALWNSGSETINYDDVAKSNPMKVKCVNGSNFLAFEIIHKSNESNGFNIVPVVNPDDPGKHLQNELEIKFDYFDKNEGIIIQFSHTGDSGDNIKITGDIKGFGSVRKIGDPIANRIPSISDYFKKIKRRSRIKILGIFLIITPFFVLVTEFIPKSGLETPVFIKYILFLIMTLMYWTLAASILKRRLPSGFDIFDDEIKPYSEEG